MAFCTNCGSKLADGAKFCANCGANIENPQVTHSSVTENSHVEPVRKPKKKHRFGKILLFTLLGIIVLLIVISQVATLSDNSPSTTLSREEYIATCIEVEYEDVARNPDTYKGKDIVVAGSVIQVQEGAANNVVLRVTEDGLFSSNTWYVTYIRKSDDESRILEGDYVTLFGECSGITSYTNVMGGKVTIPSIKAAYVENGKVINGQTIVFDKAQIAEGLEYKEYSFTSSYFNYYFLTVKNTSDYDLEITGKVTLYQGDSIVAVDGRTVNAVAPGQEALIMLMPEEEYTRTEVSFEVTQCSFTRPAVQDFEYEIVNQTESKLIVKGKNTSDEAMNATMQVLFFKGDSVVGHGDCYFYDSEYELKGKSELTEEVECYDSFDNYLIFVDAYRY